MWRPAEERPGQKAGCAQNSEADARPPPWKDSGEARKAALKEERGRRCEVPEGTKGRPCSSRDHLRQLFYRDVKSRSRRLDDLIGGGLSSWEGENCQVKSELLS